MIIAPLLGYWASLKKVDDLLKNKYINKCNLPSEFDQRPLPQTWKMDVEKC